jgi:AbrB family looped-hinge helix DNA binding protein
MTKKAASKARKVKEAGVAYAAQVKPAQETYQTSITSKGQVVIPAALRRKYGITPQIRLVISDDGEQILLKPVTHKLIDRLCGSLAGTGTMKEYLVEKAKEVEREDADLRRSR